MSACDLRPPDGLFVSGTCRDGQDAVHLISPDEPAFWPIFTTSPEYGDGDPDPMDRWSVRTIGEWAAGIGARAVFPSDGPPYPPFSAWAIRSGQFWQSPVGMLVHRRMGLFTSFRGAVVMPGAAADCGRPANATSPCEACPRPCLTACPAHAFRPAYDVGRCHDWLDENPKNDCLSAGCRVRRACPASLACGRLPEQSAWHMRAFHP